LLQFEIVIPVTAALMHMMAKYFITFTQKCFLLARGSHQCRTKSNIAEQNLQNFSFCTVLLILHATANSV